MKNKKTIKTEFEKDIQKKIMLRRKIFLEFGEIPEEVLSVLVDNIDINEEYTLRFLDDPEDFKYYIKEKTILDYEEAVEDGALGTAKLKIEILEKLYGQDILFGKYNRQDKNIVENIDGKFNLLSSYILKKQIEITEGMVVEKEIEDSENTVKVEYCIYVPNILKLHK